MTKRKKKRKEQQRRCKMNKNLFKKLQKVLKHFVILRGVLYKYSLSKSKVKDKKETQVSGK